MTRQPDAGSDGASSPYSLRDMLIVVFKRWKLIVIFAVSVATAVTVYSLLQPKVYQVSASLLVSRARAEFALAPAESSQPVPSVSEEDMNSEVEVLRSRELIEETLEILGFRGQQQPDVEKGIPDRSPSGERSLDRSAPGRKPLPSFEQMVLGLSQQIETNLVKNSNVIKVTYRSRDPEWATRVVRTFTERYLERRAERGQAREALAFFERQMQVAEKRLNESEGVLAEFLGGSQFTLSKGPQGSDSLSDQKAGVLERLGARLDERGDAEADLQELSRKIENLKSRLAEEPERLYSPGPEKQDAVAETIRQQLTTLELERDALLQDFKPDSRYVRDIETQIALARERLAEVQAKVGSIDGTEVNPIHQSLKQDLLRAEAEFEGIRARYVTLDRMATELKAELENLNRKAFELESLHRQAQAAEEEYLLYRKKHEEARISAAMDKERLINVSIVEPARRPLLPVGRGTRARVVLGLLLGVLGGFGLAFAMEFYLDHSFTTGDEIERRLGIPHIASIPEGSQ